MNSVLSKPQLLLVCFAISILTAHTLTAEQTVKVAWDASPDSNVARYNIAYGEVGSTSVRKVDAGNATSVSLSGLVEGKTYSIYATAVSKTGLESLPSEVILYTAPQANLQFTPVPNQSVTAGNSLTLQLQATTSSAGLSVTYSLVSGPAGAAVSSTGLFSWTPPLSQNPGSYQVSVKATASGTTTVSASTSFQVTVIAPVNEPINTAPVLVSVGGQMWGAGAATGSQAAINGSFEQDYSGWSATGNQQVVTFSATAGGKAIRMNSGQRTPNAVLTQVIATKPGRSYRLSFDYGVLSPIYKSEQRLKVTVKGQQELLSDTISVVTLTSTTVYNPKAYGFTADGSSVTLTLQDVSPTSDSIDSYLDNVQVVERAVLNPVLSIAAGSDLTAQIVASDSDLPANILTHSLVAGPAGANVSGTGLFSWTPALADGGTTQTITVKVTDNGVPVLSDARSFDVTVIPKLNSAPTLSSVPNQNIGPGSTCVVQLTASDPDGPGDKLTFSLVTGPSGAVIDPATGRFAWTPGSTHAGSSFPVTVQVSDSGSPALSDSTSFTIAVVRQNTAPVLNSIQSVVVAPGTTVTIYLTAIDFDLPANALTFDLVSGPSGATVDPRTGVFKWTPTLSQAGSSYTVTVQVTDDGAPALSDSDMFSIKVESSNRAPVLASIANQSVNEGSELRLQLSATDDDSASSLTYSLVSGPSGASVSSSGLFSWAPTELQGPSTTQITVRVTDAGSPALSDSKSFQVVAGEINQKPVLASIPDVRALPGQVVMLALSATDGDLPANRLSYRLVSGPSNASVDPITGVFTWRLSKSKDPATHLIAVSVTDNGSPALADTKTFSVIVESKHARRSAIGKSLSELTWIAELTDGRALRFNSPLPAAELVNLGAAYLEASSDLKTWEVIGQISDEEQLRDPAPTNSAARFYRVRTDSGAVVPSASTEVISPQ